jgi:hypothetical protein
MPSRPSRPAPAAESDLDPAVSPLPEIFCDPLASFAPTPILVDAFGQTWTVPAMTAAQWLELLWNEGVSFDDIFPGLAGAEGAMYEAFFAGETDSDQVFAMATEVLEAATGFRWWFALNLHGVVKLAWARIGGDVVARVRAEEVSLGAWLLVALQVLTERTDPKKVAEMLNALNTAPGISTNSAIDEEAEGKAFLAAMHQSL